PAAREIASPTWIIGRLDRLKMQLGANRRVAEQLFALFQRRQHYGFPGRHGVEVLRRLQGITQISRPGHDELISAMPLGMMFSASVNCLRHLSGATTCWVMLP